ncbi:MAG: DsrE family protein [Thermoguttaceae bacterium]
MEERDMRKPIFLAVVLGASVVAVLAATGPWSGSSHGAQGEPPSQLCVVWSSGDAGVAKNVCFMYTLNAKKQGWIDVVHLVVWGPSAKLLAENEELQADIKAMQKSGVVVEACVACANNYGVADELRARDIDVKPMGVPLSDRLKGPWKVLTF